MAVSILFTASLIELGFSVLNIVSKRFLINITVPCLDFY